MKKEKKKIKYALLMCFIISIFFSYSYLLRVIPSVIINDIKEKLIIDNSVFGIIIVYYYYAYTPLQILAGIIIDKYNKKYILTIACLLCAIGTLIFFNTNNTEIAKIGRFITGLGSAFAYIGILKIARIYLPKKYFATISGLGICIGMGGAIIGELFISKMIVIYKLKDILNIIIIIGILLSLIIFITIKEQKKIINKQKNNKKSTIKIIKEIVKTKILWINGIIGCLTFLPITVFAELWGIPFLEYTAKLDKITAATCSSLIFMGFCIGGPLWGLISDKIKKRKTPMLIGILLSSIIIFDVIFNTSNKYYILYIQLFLSGFLLSSQTLNFAIANDISNTKTSATVIAFTNTIIMLGGLIIQPTIGYVLKLLENTNNISTLSFNINNFQIAMAIIPISLIISIILIFYIEETYK